MKLMLSSFGINEKVAKCSEQKSVFYGMPPVHTQTKRNLFVPDYAMLLLCDKIVLDQPSYDRLSKDPHPTYLLVAETLEALNEEGFVELANYREILSKNRNLLNVMLQHDLQALEQWKDPLKASFRLWNRYLESWGVTKKNQRGAGEGGNSKELDEILDLGFLEQPHLSGLNPYKLQNLRGYYSHDLYHGAGRRSTVPAETFTGFVREILKDYLSYVNSNIVLSNELGVGFHDWMDFQPFYRQKFLYIGRLNAGAESQVQESQKLFEIFFPRFTITSTRSFIDALKDKRVERLRTLVQEAVDGKTKFDRTFATEVLGRIRGISRKSKKYRRVISYLTLPLTVLPWIGSLTRDAARDAAGAVIEKRLREPYQWFYLLSELE